MINRSRRGEKKAPVCLRNCEDHMVTRHIDAASSYIGDLCKYRIVHKILSRLNIYAILFIYPRQAPMGKVLL